MQLIQITAGIGQVELLEAFKTAVVQGQLHTDIANEILVQILSHFTNRELADYIRVNRFPKDFIKELIDLL